MENYKVIFTVEGRRNALKRLGKKYGLPTKNDGDLSEIRSHYMAEKVLHLIDPDLNIIHNPEKSRIDLTFQSGKTIGAEIKFREIPHNTFPTAYLSPEKAEELFKRGDWLVYPYDDGYFYIWDCSKYQPPRNKHFTKRYEHTYDFGNGKGKYVLEQGYDFDFSKAIYRGSIAKGKEFFKHND